MKTFKTDDLGGMPLVLDDFRFMQSIHKEAFVAIMKPYAKLYDVIILDGCERSVTSGNVTIEDGWILYNGVVVKVYQQSYSDTIVSPDFEFWNTEEIALSIDNSVKNFLQPTSNPVTTYFETKGVIDIATSGTLKYNDTPRFFDILDDMYKFNLDLILQNTQVIPPTGFYPGTYKVYYYKDASEQIKLKGEYAFEDLDPGDTLFSISSSLPVLSPHIIVPVTTEASLLLHLEIIGGGDVKFRGWIGNSVSSGIISFVSVPIN